MYLYDCNGKRIKYDTTDKLGEGLIYSDVYKISDEVCLKVFKTISDDINFDVLSLIKDLELSHFYIIYDFLFNKTGKFNGYTMKYYPGKTIDILTMPTSYTLDNFSSIYNSILKLTDNGIVVSDLHSGNVITDENNITVIDADLYYKLCFIDKIKLQYKNISALIYLFKDLYFESLDEFHKDCDVNACVSTIRNLFEPMNALNIDKVYKKLTRYKYPIDYIKSR